ncbi:putative Ankyrin repeat-containing protein [Seiridium unicorne]|uniref:Ankyrin repeat-containing protein n=1 Tax=Seiridium unicorne TaxID=138068 RepID=A0ABR2UPV9_9PEZI
MISQSAFNDLCDALEADDPGHLKELCEKPTLSLEDAQSYLQNLVTRDIDVDVIRALLNNGASAKSLSPSYLRNCRSLELLELLAENGLNFKDEGHKILENALPDREIIDFLLDQGADINRTDTEYDTNGERLPPMARTATSHGALFDKTLSVLNNAAALGDVDLFDYLVSRGAEPAKSIALHTAAHCLDLAKVKAMIAHLIVEYGFDPNADDNPTGMRLLSMMSDDTGVPLDFAIRFKNLAAVEALLQHGADPNVRDHIPLRQAVALGSAAIKPFLEAGADANVALSKAVKTGELQIAKLCIEHKADPRVALNEIAADKLEVNQEMLDLLGNK